MHTAIIKLADTIIILDRIEIVKVGLLELLNGPIVMLILIAQIMKKDVNIEQFNVLLTDAGAILGISVAFCIAILSELIAEQVILNYVN